MNDLVSVLNSNNGIIEFEDPITVKDSPHSWPTKIKSVFSNNGNIFYENKEGIKRPLIENTKEYYSVMQRIRITIINKK